MDGHHTATHARGRSRFLPWALGGLLGLIGLALTVGGVWLALLGGSLYYVIAGLALLASGVLIARRSMAGVLFYVALFIGTIAWAFWEVGGDAWALVPRLFGPAVLFLLVVPSFVFFLSPLLASLSRRDEYQADAYAVQQTAAEPMATALLKLYEDNASTLTPDPVYVKFYYSHPPASSRLARMGMA